MRLQYRYNGEMYNSDCLDRGYTMAIDTDHEMNYESHW